MSHTIGVDASGISMVRLLSLVLSTFDTNSRVWTRVQSQEVIA